MNAGGPAGDSRRMNDRGAIDMSHDSIRIALRFSLACLLWLEGGCAAQFHGEEQSDSRGSRGIAQPADREVPRPSAPRPTAGARAVAGMAAAGSGGAGASGDVSCGSTLCTSMQVPGLPPFAAPCCADAATSACGTLDGGLCMPTPPTLPPAPNCPVPSFSGFVFVPCCIVATNTCGIDASMIGMGCVPLSMIPATTSASGARCDGSFIDGDAGVGGAEANP